MGELLVVTFMKSMVEATRAPNALDQVQWKHQFCASTVRNG